MKRLDICIIRAFAGHPRYELCENIWQTIAEWLAPSVRVRVFPNPGARLRHAQCYDLIWKRELEYTNDYLLLTEFDFLPDLTIPFWTLSPLLDRYAAVGYAYTTRCQKKFTMLQDTAKMGGWFVALNKHTAPRDLSFEGTPDPCNQLKEHLAEYGLRCGIYPGNDAFPEHYGMEYLSGTHLFWSRHWADPPSARVSGFSMRAVQNGVDKRIRTWIAEQPQDFQTLLAERLRWNISELCSGRTDLRRTYRTSNARSRFLAEASAV